FRDIWRQVGSNIEAYNSYPRLVGETGGKDFIFAHSSCDTDALSSALIRGAFEYQGQKCSAASRAFIPQSIWEEVLKQLKEKMADLKVGDVKDFRNFLGAVIDEASFNNIESYLQHAKSSPDAEIIIGGGCSKEKGFFVEPTIIKASTPYYKAMTEEIFGPVLAIYVYPDDKFYETLKACDTASPYALTGAVFGNDRKAVIDMTGALRNTAGNIYINDKPTGATVGQQPFGGSRASGTNDKAGSQINLYRWLSIHSIKDCLMPTGDVVYPFMDEE
ncbi:MAG: aldehyde dehydrogenase family protein, partial [Oscillospiraceae bacterium]